MKACIKYFKILFIFCASRLPQFYLYFMHMFPYSRNELYEYLLPAKESILLRKLHDHVWTGQMELGKLMQFILVANILLGSSTKDFCLELKSVNTFLFNYHECFKNVLRMHFTLHQVRIFFIFLQGFHQCFNQNIS